MRSSTAMPLGARLDADRLEPEPRHARGPARGHQQALAAQLAPVGEADHVLAVLAGGARRVLAQPQLDPLGGQGLGQQLPERRRLAAQQVRRAVGQRHPGAHPRRGLGHLDADGAAAQDHQALRHPRHRHDLAVGPEAVEPGQPRDGGHDRRGPGAQHDGVGLVHPLPHLHPARARDAAGAPDQVDAVVPEPARLPAVVPAGGDAVPPGQRRPRRRARRRPPRAPRGPGGPRPGPRRGAGASWWACTPSRSTPRRPARAPRRPRACPPRREHRRTPPRPARPR